MRNTTTRHLRSLTALAAASGLSTAAPITVDGLFDDWQQIPAAHTDPASDAGAGPDLVSLSIADDDHYLYLRLESAAPFDLSELNNLEIVIDGDGDPQTGNPIMGLGAELLWRPGSRTGIAYATSWSNPVSHPDIGFRAAPTINASVFEIAIALDAETANGSPLFAGPDIRIRINDPSSGESLPDGAATSVAYTLGQGDPTPPVTPLQIERTNPTDLRVMTHNVLRDNLFVPPFQPRFQRLYTAAAPDILHLQEIYGASAAQTRDLIAPWLEAAGLGNQWHAARANDNITVSRFPVLDSWAIGGNLAVLLDTTEALGTPMLAINAHLYCCANDTGRQREVDEIIAFIRDAYAPGTPIGLAPDTPVTIAGDLNLVGEAQQLETLLTGDIANNAAFGADHAPDPDGSPLTSVISRQTEQRMGYTWRDDSSSFWPGQLDYLIYSDSVLTRTHDFILYTPEMSAAALQANGLEANDSLVSDHLVFVADFAAPCAEARATADLNGDTILDLADISAFIAAFMNQQPPADLAPPQGVYDLSDIGAFINAFTADCPAAG